jgi:hypothetical protein
MLRLHHYFFFKNISLKLTIPHDSSRTGGVFLVNVQVIFNIAFHFTNQCEFNAEEMKRVYKLQCGDSCGLLVEGI